MMSPVLLLAFLYLCSPVTSQSYWYQQRDDLSEYQLDRVKTNVRNNRECAYYAQSQHQAVQFSQVEGSCSMYSCLRGFNGCRKCRNAKNSSLPLLIVRPLNQPGRNCWRTFQHRVDGSVDFYRNWTSYLTSFGQGEDRNYWMGLEAIFQLTKNGDRRARWEMGMWNGSWFWWEDLYLALQGVDQVYRATIGDQDLDNSNVFRQPVSDKTSMNNQKFSTPENDQDSTSMNCASSYQGAWWYKDCHSFNPNGKYYTPPTVYNLAGGLFATGLTFWALASVYPLNHYYSMQTVECMVSDTV